MFFILILLTSGLVTSTVPKGNDIYKYRAITLPRTPKISDEELVIKDFSTFVHNHSRRDPGGNKTYLRLKNEYPEPDIPGPLHVKFFSFMKQSIYSSQDRLKYLHGLLDKYEDDQCFRAGYIFTKLDQLLYDMRRIHAYAKKKFDYRTIIHNIIFYKHVTKKNVDVTYIVEYLFDFHEINMNNINRVLSQLPGSQ